MGRQHLNILFDDMKMSKILVILLPTQQCGGECSINRITNMIFILQCLHLIFVNLLILKEMKPESTCLCSALSFHPLFIS